MDYYSKFLKSSRNLSLNLFLILFLVSFNLFSAPARTIKIVNNCPFVVMWSAKGTPIKDKGDIVTCPTGTPFGTACFNNQGYCGQAVGAETIKCYFKYPSLVNKTDNNPDYVLASKAEREYTVNLINRNDPPDAGTTAYKPVTQYSLNFVSNSDCSQDANGDYSCNSAVCGDRLYSSTTNMVDSVKKHKLTVNLPTSAGSIHSGGCSPDRGPDSAFTQAEITMNDKQNDFYDISIINGVNVPISITPVAPAGSSFGTQPAVQSNFFCKITGGPVNSTDKTKLNGCSWEFSAPTTYLGKAINPHVFLEVSANSSATRCTTDADCTAAGAGSRCGLYWPESYKSYDGKGYCGKPIAYQTIANISPLVSPAGINSQLNSLFNLRDSFNLTLNDGSGTQSFTNNQLFMCKTTEVNKNLYLDSCYNYCVPGTGSASGACSDAEKAKKASTACCGCIDWPGVPTDDKNLCPNVTATTAAYPPLCPANKSQVPPACRTSDLTKISNPNQPWTDKVKPLVEWLVKACPDAYEYQYGDKHGTVQCSSQSDPSNPGNNINYTITFCPSGKGLFTANAPDAVNITGSTSTVLGSNSVKIDWQVASNVTGVINSYLTITGPNAPTGNLGACTANSCSYTFSGPTALTANSTYSITIVANLGSLNATKNINVKTGTQVSPPVVAAIKTSGICPSTLSDPTKINLATKANARVACLPGQFYPCLSTCTGTKSGVSCVNAPPVGQWKISWANGAPIGCSVLADYQNPVIDGMTATYNNNGSKKIKFTFIPNKGWTCQQQGDNLICNQQ